MARLANQPWGSSSLHLPGGLQAHDTSYQFFYDSSGIPNPGRQACGPLYSLDHLPAFTYSLDSAHEMTHNLSFSPPSPSLVSSSPLLSLPSRLRVLNELFDMHHPQLPFSFLRQVSLCSPGRSGTWERSPVCLPSVPPHPT